MLMMVMLGVLLRVRVAVVRLTLSSSELVM